MRLSIQKKIIFLGSALSLLLLSAAFLTSFLIYQSRTKKNYIESVDNSIHEIEYTLTTEDATQDLSRIVANFIGDFYKIKDNVIPEFETREEEFDYYKKIYTDIYPGTGMNLSKYKLQYQSDYLEISSRLSNAAISAGSKSAYAGIILDNPVYGFESSRLLYLFDSNFRFTDYENGNMFGSYYELTADDHDVDPLSSMGEYLIKGRNARVIDINLGKLDDILNKYADGAKYDEAKENFPEWLDTEIVITAFIEYDLYTINDSLAFFVTIELSVLAAVFIVLLFVYILIARFVLVKNIKSLTDSTNEFTNNIRNGNKIDVIDPKIKSKDEIGDLAKSYVTMESEIIDYTNKVLEATKEKERMNADIAIAAKIQLDALPSRNINDENVLISASISQAKEVGGDFYDYFYIDSTHLAFLISDVSGKGIPAALFMMRTRELIKSKLIMNKALEDICYEVNNELLINNEEGLFVTSFIAILDIENNVLKYINAGHEKPYLISKNGVKQLNVKSNFILGGMENYKYEKEELKLEEGDKLFIHTDGLNEAINKDNIEFGYDNIIKCLCETTNYKNQDVVNELKNRLMTYSDGMEMFDDVTMLLIERKSSSLDFNFTNPNFDIIDIVTNKFNDYYSYLEKKTISEIDIIFDEILNNYVSYNSNLDLYIKVSIKLIKDNIIIDIINNGEMFNPLDKPINVITDELPNTVGGFGFTIIKKLSNDLKYEYKNNENHLIITKKI